MESRLGRLARKQDVFEDSRDFNESTKMKTIPVFTLGLFSLVEE
jgi:hypothetical protein